MKTVPLNCEKCFDDYKEALEELRHLVYSARNRELDRNSQTKLIRSFEVTHELAMKSIGEFFRKEGRRPFSGSRDATVEAFNEDLIDDGAGWLDMIICRIKYNPLYPEDYQSTLITNVLKKYFGMFENFERKMGRRLEI